MFNVLKKIFKQLKNASLYSFDGLRSAFEDEFAFRLEVFVVVASPAAFYFGHTALERIVLIGSLFIVLITELLNSAIEAILNKVDSNWCALIKKAKDMGSAAVMVAIVNALIVWIMMIVFN